MYMKAYITPRKRKSNAVGITHLLELAEQNLCFSIKTWNRECKNELVQLQPDI